MDHRDNDIPGARRCGGIGNQNITVLDAAFCQRIALDAHRISMRPP